MLPASRRCFRIFAGLAAFSVAGTAATVWFGVNPGPIAPIASVMLILSGTLVIFFELGFSWRMAGVLALSAAIEVIGLLTGLPFGRYVYTDRWWPTVAFGEGHYFPLLLPFAWVLIVGGAWSVATRLVSKPWVPWLAALLATLVDAPMERAMCDVLGYWRWIDGGPVFGAPFLNSAGWFLTALIGASLMSRNPADVRPRESGSALVVFCAFVAFVGWIHFFDWAWICLLTLCGLFLAILVKTDKT